MRLSGTKKAIGLLVIGALTIGALTAIVLNLRQDRGFIMRPCLPSAETSTSVIVHMAVHWPVTSYPIPVRIDPIAVEWTSAIEEAIAFWNREAGKRLLTKGATLTAERPPDPVIVIEQINADDHGSARLYWGEGCVLERVELRLPGLAPKSTWARIARHELGHALGLDHDDWESSVMYPRANESGGSLTKKDRGLLQ